MPTPEERLHGDTLPFTQVPGGSRGTGQARCKLTIQDPKNTLSTGHLKTLPNFLGIGALRCGTTWLDHQLRHHPSIYLPTARKEVHFFDRYYDRGLDWYQNFFPENQQASKYRCIGEISPSYMYDADVPALIHKHLPRCKFIAILRNPADRVYSQYLHFIRNNNEEMTFREFLERKPDAFPRSLYGEQIRRCLSYFPLQNFLILIFEETMAQPERAFEQIADFLSVDASLFQKVDKSKKVNPSYSLRFTRSYALASRCLIWLRKKDLDWVYDMAKAVGLGKELFGVRSDLPEIDPSIRRELLARYTADISDLEHLLDIDLSIWRK